MNSEIKILTERILSYIAENKDYGENRSFIENELNRYRERLVKEIDKSNGSGKQGQNDMENVNGALPTGLSNDPFLNDEIIGED